MDCGLQGSNVLLMILLYELLLLIFVVITSEITFSVEDVAAKAGIGLGVLSRECSQDVLLKLANFCSNWKLIGRHLRLEEREITAVDEDHNTMDERRFAMLVKWRDKFAFRATYDVFIKALLAAGKTQDALEACKVIRAASSH